MEKLSPQIQKRVNKMEKKFFRLIKKKKKSDGLTFSSISLVDACEKYINNPFLKGKIALSVGEAVIIFDELMYLEEKYCDNCLDYHSVRSFLLMYCQKLKEKEISFQEWQRLWKRAKQVVEKDRKSEIVKEIYEILKLIDVSPVNKLSFLGDLGKYAEEDLADGIEKDIMEFPNKMELLSSLDLEVGQDPFLLNVYIREYLKENPATSFSELMTFLQKMDEGQFRGKEWKMEILNKHSFLVKPKPEEELDTLKEKHRAFREFICSYSLGDLEELETRIWDLETAEIETPDQAYEYCRQIFGHRWHVNLPEWARRKDVSPRELVKLLKFGEHLNVSYILGCGCEREEETSSTKGFGEKIKEMIKDKEAELKNMETLDLTFMLDDLNKLRCGEETKGELKISIAYAIGKEIISQYREDFLQKFNLCSQNHLQNLFN